MDRLIVMIARVADEELEGLTEVWRHPLPPIVLEEVAPNDWLDKTEGIVCEVGRQVMQRLFVEQWRLADNAFMNRYYHNHAAEEGVMRDGFDAVKVSTRFGVVRLPRQVCENVKNNHHMIPGNDGLPAHHGQITTRGLQEWICLLPQDVSFATAQRLLGLVTGNPDTVSETQMRRWVSYHGKLIREAERQEVIELSKRNSLDCLKAQMVPLADIHHPVAWQEAQEEAVKAALQQSHNDPPEGVSATDWDRLLTARIDEKDPKKLRRLGPEVRPGEIVAGTDDVCVRSPEKRQWLELRTACVRTSEGIRYLSGAPEMVLQQLYLLLVLCGGIGSKLTLLGDGAKWIASFFTERLAGWMGSEFILDWYHLAKKCSDLASMICRDKIAKKALLGKLFYSLWNGKSESALSLLRDYRPQAKSVETLDILIAYLSNRIAFLPNYKYRRRNRQFIGSGFAEKANDLIVSRRQKHQGMHWSQDVSDALAALRTLTLNRSWDQYWQQGKVLPLAASA